MQNLKFIVFGFLFLMVMASCEDDEIVCEKDEEPTEDHLSLSLQPAGDVGKDSVFSKIVPNNNYGDLEGIHLYAWTQSGILNVNRVAIDFDLTSLPADAQIDSVFLSLYFNETSPYGEEHSGTTDFVIQRITSSWTESTITWNTQPSTTTTNQVHIDGATLPTQDFINMNVTQLVRDIISNKANSFGMLLKLEAEDPYRMLLLASSDHPKQNIRPKLDVFYTIKD